MNIATPAIVSQSAVRRLPRLALLLLCVAYVLPGFLGREPWKDADLAAFGVMWEMATGRGDWWQPQVLGLAAQEAGLLPYWLGAIFIQLLPFVPASFAARIPFGLLLTLTLVCTWYAVYHLARQPSAQPVSFAFGGEAQPVDYARAIADAALLALVACLGLAQLAHETTADLVRLAMVSVMLYAAAALAHRPVRRPLRAQSAWGLSALALVFSGAPWIAAVLGVGLLLGVFLARRAGAPAAAHGWPAHEPVRPAQDPLLWATLLLLLVLAVAALLGLLPRPALAATLDAAHWASWGRMLLWFTWPAWPLVLWTLWRWRHQLLQPHLALPLSVALVGVAASSVSAERDRALLLALPALAALAAFALPTLKRSVAALIDWFTLLFFSGCALIIWVLWLAMETGVPARPAANVARLAPGYEHEFSLLLFLLAALASVAWTWLLSWRVRRHREAIWKSLVLPAGGSTLCWLLLMTLWLPLLDYGLSYGPTARRIAGLVPPQTCVLVDGLTQAQIAGLQYHGRLQLQRSSAADPTADCQTLLVSLDSRPTLEQRIDLTQWTHKTTVHRLNDRTESLLLYRRLGG